MVDVAGGQTVTVKCLGSQILGIHLHQPMKGVEVYEGSTLVITPEQFKPGNYRCRCDSSIVEQLNVSKPIAITGEGRGRPLLAHVQVCAVWNIQHPTLQQTSLGTNWLSCIERCP